MSKEDRYFQFPLCALSFGSTIRERCSHIITWSFVEAGETTWQKFDHPTKEKWVAYFKALKSLPGHINWKSDDHMAYLYGRHLTNVANGSLKADGEEYGRLKQFKASFEGRHGRDVEVRLKTGLLFEVRDGKGMSGSLRAILEPARRVVNCFR